MSLTRGKKKIFGIPEELRRWAASELDPIKHVLRVFERPKNIPGKACVKRVHNNDAFVNVGN